MDTASQIVRAVLEDEEDFEFDAKDAALSPAQEDFYWHVTRKRDLPMIQQQGLKPSIPADFKGEEEAVFLFPDRDAADDGFNWLEDRFEDDEELVILKIDGRGLRIEPSTVDYEVLCRDVIPPDHIIAIEEY